MNDFFYPEYEVKVGKNIITEAIQLETQLDNNISFDWTHISFTNNLLAELNIKKEDEFSLSIGYEGGLEEIFTGYVTDIQGNTIIIKNEMLKLAKVKITNSFISSIPQEIITFILEKAGVIEYELSKEAYPIKKLLNLSKVSGTEALKMVDKAFNIPSSTSIFKCKKFEWNVPARQDKIYNFIYAENIINLEPTETKTWELTTIAVPFVKIFNKINVEHPKVSGEFDVNQIKIMIDESGFIRTRLTFKE